MKKVFKNKAISKKIVNIILNTLIVIFSVFLLISIYTGVQIKFLGQKYADFFGYSIFEVQTDSMAKAISSGDWVVVKLTKDVKLDDIITYELKGDYITHRVIEIYHSTYITKGDANSGKDEPVDESQIVGKLAFTLGKFGIYRKVLFNLPVLIALIITLFLFDYALKKDDKNKFFKLLFNKKKKLQKESQIEETPNDKQLISNEMKTEPVTVITESEIVFEALPEEPDSKFEESEIKDEIILESEETEVSEIKEITDLKEDEPLIDEIDEDLEEYDSVADELEKTQFFRIIPVDVSELDENRLKIAEQKENEVSNSDEEKTSDEKIIFEEEEYSDFDDEEDDEDKVTEIDLELIKNSPRKNKNIIDAMVNIKKDELYEMLSVFSGTDKLQTNEATIRNAFITTYIHAKYYNYYSEKDIEYQGRNLVSKIIKITRIVANELIQDYNGNDSKFGDKVNFYSGIIEVIADIDHAKDYLGEGKSKKDFYREKIISYNGEWDAQKIESIVDDVLEIQKTYEEISKYFFKKLETNTFDLTLTKVMSKRDIYAVNLEHKMNFSRIYSDYIVDKMFTEGVIAEDKVPVTFTLLMGQLVRDMLTADFKSKYVVDLPETLYKKEKKLWRVLKTIDDEYAKAHVILHITFSELILNKNIVKKIRKKGYKIAISIPEGMELEPKERSNLYMARLIFINKKDSNYEKQKEYIPEDIIGNIIYDDIVSKTSSTGGEQ